MGLYDTGVGTQTNEYGQQITPGWTPPPSYQTEAEYRAQHPDQFGTGGASGGFGSYPNSDITGPGGLGIGMPGLGAQAAAGYAPVDTSDWDPSTMVGWNAQQDAYKKAHQYPGQGIGMAPPGSIAQAPQAPILNVDPSQQKTFGNDSITQSQRGWWNYAQQAAQKASQAAPQQRAEARAPLHAAAPQWGVEGGGMKGAAGATYGYGTGGAGNGSAYGQQWDTSTDQGKSWHQNNAAAPGAPGVAQPGGFGAWAEQGNHWTR